MSLSKEYTTYYLTDEGWMEVFRKIDFSGETQTNPEPEKYYMICTYKEQMASRYSPMEEYSVVNFEDKNKKKRIIELIEKFGKCPEHL